MKKEMIGAAIGVAIISAGIIFGVVSATKEDLKETKKVEIREYSKNIIKVRSKSTGNDYNVVDYRPGSRCVFEIKIYNYFTDKYEWYPLYKFENDAAIAAYLGEEYYSITDFSEGD